MTNTPKPLRREDAERDSELYLRGFLGAEDLVRRARERVAAEPVPAFVRSNVARH